MTKKIPMRQCIGCGQMKSKKELLRILKTPEGEITMDVTGRKNGRGAYLCISGECLQRAVRTKGLERSFQMKIPPEVYERLEKEFKNIMVNKVYSMIGLAEKAGNVVSGEFSTEKAVKSGKACLVILASDASGNTRKHFSDMCAYRNIGLCVYGNKEELGHAIGKEMRANLAVTDKGFADAIRKRIEELK